MMTPFDEVDSKVPTTTEVVRTNILIRFLKVLRSIKVEPIMFFVMFGMLVRTVPSLVLLQDRACLLHLSLPESVCRNLTEYPDKRIEVQKLANIYNMCHTVISILPAVITTMFATPWSNKYGRRYPVLIALLGLIIDSVGMLLFSISSTAPLWLYLLSPISSGLSGGMMIAITAVYSYMSEVTHDKNRAIRFAILEFVFIMAMPLGTEVGGQVLKYSGYVAVIGITASSYLAAFLWTIFTFWDIKDDFRKASKKEIARDLISSENIKKSLITTVKKRHGTIRKQLWLLMIVMCCTLLMHMGTAAIGLQHGQLMYRWDPTEYSDISTVVTILHSVIMMFSIYCFTRILYIADASIGLIGSISATADCILRAAAYKSWIYYYARAAGSFTSCANIAVRSRLSKLIPKEEQSEIFAVLAVFESFTPIIAAVMFPSIYNATAHFYPGMVFVVAALITLIPIQIFWWLSRIPDVSYRKLREEEEMARTIYMEDQDRY